MVEEREPVQPDEVVEDVLQQAPADPEVPQDDRQKCFPPPNAARAWKSRRSGTHHPGSSHILGEPRIPPAILPGHPQWD